jgi:hypothetical protein
MGTIVASENEVAIFGDHSKNQKWPKNNQALSKLALVP